MPQAPETRSPEQAQADINRAEAARLLFQYGQPYSQRYEAWSQEHPILSTGLEVATSAIPVSKVVKKIPGLGSIGNILEASEKLLGGGLGGWGGGGQAQIANPKLKWGKPKRDENYANREVYHIPILDRKTNDRLGSIGVSLDRDKGEAYIGSFRARSLPEDIGPGHLLHIKDELANLPEFKDIKQVRFFRIENMDNPNPNRLKRSFREITLPIMRGRKGESGTPLTRDPTAKKEVYKTEGDYTVSDEDMAQAERIANEVASGHSARSIPTTGRRQRETLQDMEPYPQNMVPVHPDYMAWYEHPDPGFHPPPVSEPPIGSNRRTLEDYWWHARNYLNWARGRAGSSKDLFQIEGYDPPIRSAEQVGQDISNYRQAEDVVNAIEARLRAYRGRR